MVKAGPARPELDGLNLAKRELRRARTQGLGLTVATYLIATVALATLSLIGTPADWWGAALFLAFVAMSLTRAAMSTTVAVDRELTMSSRPLRGHGASGGRTATGSKKSIGGTQSSPTRP